MAVIKLIGPGTIAEGNFAIFAVALDEQLSPSLAAGAFIDISLDSAPGSATEATDFARLVATDLLAADSSKLRLSNFSTNSSTGAVSFRVTNIGTTSLPPGTSLLSFALATREDTAVEPDEDYSVSLAATSAGDSVATGAAVVTTTIGTIRPRVLNWGASVGNRTIDTTGSFLVPELDFERFARGVGAGSLVAGGRYQILYPFRGRDAPVQDCAPDDSSLSDQATVSRVTEFRDPAAGMASPRRGDGQSRPAPGTARHPFLVV